MHYHVYVLLPIEQASNSMEARQKASAYLMDNEFASGQGRWGSGVSDWFVVGGRWSGKMTMMRLDQIKLTKFWKRFGKQKLGWSGKGISEEERKIKIQNLFLKYFPETNAVNIPCPPSRSPYADSGYEDDAIVVDEFIWNEIILPGFKKSLYDGGAIIHVNGCEESESELNEESIIGKCWCVLIDFHN